MPSTGRTVYVLTRTTCTTDTGTGTQAAPFCSLQHGVDAAVSGDTVRVDGKDEGVSPPSDMEAVVVHTSGLTLTGGTNTPQILSFNNAAGKPALTLDGVSDVTVSHLSFNGGNAPGLLVKGSSRITLDSDHLDGSGGNALTIDGTSSAISVTRSHASMFYPVAGSATISVAAGAKNITLAGNLVSGATTDNSQTIYQATGGIAATGVQGLNVTGNTVQRGCLPGIAVDGASTAVSIQNNLLVETAAVAACDSGQPALTVSAESAPATTTDYNDFYAESATGAGPYRWAGTAYPTVAAFQAAQTQGAHDTVETVAPQQVNSGSDWGVAYALQTGSAAIGTANQSAPGALTTDYFGHGPMADRGAVKFQSNNPGFAMALTAKNTSAFGVSLALDVTTLPVAQDIYIQWGDGTNDVLNFYGDKPVKTTAGHIYQKLGDYTITVTDYEKTGNTIRNTVKVSTLGSQYTAYGPKRLLDSRDGTGLAAAGRVPAYGTVKLKVGGANGIPANATAAVLNLTVTGPAADGFITAYPDGGPRPATSNVNYRAKQTVPNLVMVPIGDNGYVDLYNSGQGTTDLVADITGYFTPTAAPASPLSARAGWSTPGMAPAPRVARFPGAAPSRCRSPAPPRPAGRQHLRGRAERHRHQPARGGLPDRLPERAGHAHRVQLELHRRADHRQLGRRPGGCGRQDPVVQRRLGRSRRGHRRGRLLQRQRDGRVHAGRPDAAARHPRPGDLGRRLAEGPVLRLPADDHAHRHLGVRLQCHCHQHRCRRLLGRASDPNTVADYKSGHPYPVYTPNTSALNWRRGTTVPNLVQVTPGRGVIDFFNQSDGNIDLVVDLFGYYQND